MSVELLLHSQVIEAAIELCDKEFTQSFVFIISFIMISLRLRIKYDDEDVLVWLEWLRIFKYVQP